ncbi:MAG TPA: hypothetical protein VF593_04585 [Chthoniobacteraceae bacterium]|jgi:hypothetical protein
MKFVRPGILFLAVAFIPNFGRAHESFLPLHHHSSSHTHSIGGEEAHSHAHEGGKDVRSHSPHSTAEHRFAFAAGGRFTRYSLEGEKAHLWETGVGFDYAVLPWLHLGGDVSYGWFDSDAGRAAGLLAPHAHVDFHIPIAPAWEVIAGFEVGFPGGEEALVGKHWELAPHVELRYDRGGWFAEAGARLVFVTGEDNHEHEHAAHEHAEEAGETEEHGEEEEHHGEEEAHGEEEHHEAGATHVHAADFHETVEPHGERELQYSVGVGVRLLQKRLTLETQLTGVRVLAGETPADDYLRAGVRGSWALTERVLLTTEGSIPITDAERNQWQTSMGVRVSF